MDENDMFGYSSWHYMTLPSFMFASGQWSILKDSTDKPVINLNNETYIEIFHKYMNMMTDSMMFYDGNKKQPRDDFISEKMFRNEQILFFTEITYYAIELSQHQAYCYRLSLVSCQFGSHVSGVTETDNLTGTHIQNAGKISLPISDCLDVMMLLSQI